MFTRYWRNYPWFLQLFLFVTMMFTFLWLGRSVVWSLLPKLTDVPIKDILEVKADSSLKVVRAALLANTLVHICVFSLPPLLFAYFTHPRPAQLLGLRLPGKPVHWLLVTGIMLGFLPLSLSLEAWMQQHINFGAWAKDMQTETDSTFAAYLNMRSKADLIKVFIAFAIVPPIGEELLFRGVIMRFAHKRARFPLPGISRGVVDLQPRKNAMLMPVLLTSAMFAFMHPNPYGALFIFSAGILLSVIYWLTGSLLCSIWAHLLFNGSQVVGIFLSSQAAQKTATDTASQSLPIWMPVAGLIVLTASLYGLYKWSTPLSPDWSSDFSYEELKAMNEERNRQNN